MGAVARALRKQYKDFDHYNLHDPLEELLFIVCSTKTAEAGYRATYESLRNAFPTNDDLLSAPESRIALVLQRGGLARKKAAIIKRLLEALVEVFGRPTLDPLRAMDDSECERFLISLPGVGKKVARCVMMYALDRKVFPVDEHCWRISKRLGWIRQTRKNRSGSPRDEDRLQSKIPPPLRFSLHVNMISLGRAICRAQNPACDKCPIANLCRKIGTRRDSRRASKRMTTE